MADAVEAFGQHVDKESADELVCGQRHRSVAAGTINPIVLAFKRYGVLVRFDQAPVGDGDTVRVARQVGEHGFRPGKRAFGVNNPLGFAQRFKERVERCPFRKRFVFAKELQLSGLMGCNQHR